MPLNTVILIGNLVKDPEMKVTTKGTEILSNTIAVPRRFDKNTTDFIRFVCTKNDAKFLSQYAHKGSKISIRGELHINEYTDQSGRKCQTPEIFCDMVTIESSSGKADNAVKKESEKQTAKPNTDDEPEFEEADDDELPF